MKCRILFLLICNVILCNAQIYINGVLPAYDKLSDTYLLSVSEDSWNKVFVANVTSGIDPLSEISIDGNKLIDNRYDFGQLSDKTYDVLLQGSNITKHLKLQFTYFPILVLNGQFGYEYSKASVTLQTHATVAEVMTARVKWRGGTTNATNKNKRNYKLNFEDINGENKDYKFFNLRSDNTWILDAGQVDMFRVRNRVSADLWNDFATKPYYSLVENKVKTASRGKLVELFLNDEYAGLYNMCEPIDRKQLRIKKFDDTTGEIHGGLWKATSWGIATFWDYPPNYDNTSAKWGAFEAKYPEIDDHQTTDYSTLSNAIKFVVKSSDKDFADSVNVYFDIPVIIDYFIFCNVLNGYDIAGKNIYWAVYDKQKNRMLTPAMWDMDCVVGQHFINYETRPNVVLPDNDILYPTKLVWRLFDLNVNGFKELFRTRYFELRETYLNAENLIKRFEDYYNLIKECGCCKREEMRWSYDSDISGLPLDFYAELEYIKWWIYERLEYLDAQWGFSTEIEPINDVSSKEEFIYNLNGVRVDASYKGYVIKNGRILINH